MTRFQARRDILPSAQTALWNELRHVKVSFFAGLGFGRVGEPEVTEDDVLLVASADDLLAHN